MTSKSAANSNSKKTETPEMLGPYRLDELVGEYPGYAVFAATHRRRRQSVLLYLVPTAQGDAQKTFKERVAIASKSSIEAWLAS